MPVAYISECVGQVRILLSSGQGQGHRSRRARLCILFAGGLPSIKVSYCCCL